MEKYKCSFSFIHRHSCLTTISPVRPGNKKEKDQMIENPIVLARNICEPQIAPDVISSRQSTITASISHPQREGGGQGWGSRWERNVFSLLVVKPNGPSKMCTNQLACLTSEMACQPVNLEERGMTANSYHCLTVKGVRWVDESDGGSDGQMLLMAESGRVEGSIKKTTSGTNPRRKRKIQ